MKKVFERRDDERYQQSCVHLSSPWINVDDDCFSVTATFILLKWAIVVAAQNQIFPGGSSMNFMQLQSNNQNYQRVNPSQQIIPPIHENMCIRNMDGMVFPDPDNCDVFVMCQNGMVMRQRCQPGTLFDLSLYYCSAAHTVNCGSRKLQNVPVPPTPQRPVPPSSEAFHSVRNFYSKTSKRTLIEFLLKVCRNVRDGTLIQNPNNCRAFIECQQNLRLDRECASGELFEARNGICLSAFTVDCGDRIIEQPKGNEAISNVSMKSRDNEEKKSF